MNALKVTLMLLLLSSLGGCSKMFFSMDDFPKQEMVETLNHVGAAMEGATKMFAYPNRARVDEADASVLCAGSREHTEQLCADRHGDKTGWFLQNKAKDEILLDAGEMSAERLSTFEVDYHWHYVAMVISEEGHPSLLVYDLRQWLREKRKPSPVMVVHPYPGTVHLKGWSNNELLSGLGDGSNRLRFSSDGPVLATDKRSELDEPYEKMRDFRYSPSSGEIEQYGE